MDIELKSFPFDSMKVLNEQSGELEDDRLYEAQIFRDYFRKFLSNGVYFGQYKNYGENSMKVILDNGLTIKVKKGCGIIEGADYENESDRLITLERPASGNRVDRIVVQMNSSLETRKSKLIVKQGNGTTPAELTRTDNIYEICIAEVTVKSTSNISAEDITDTRLDITLCGIVNSLISVSGEELYQQFQAYVRSVEENMMLKNEDIVDDLNSEDTDKSLSANQGKKLNDSKVDKNQLFNLIYPIGSIYMSVNNIDPHNLFGGAWVIWGAGKVPVGVSTSETEFDEVEKTGGNKTHVHTTGEHVLTIPEMPVHNHPLQNSGMHTHGTRTTYSKDATTGGSAARVNGSGTEMSTGLVETIGNGDHTHDMVPVGGNRPHSHGNTGNASNLQPYITCYMWKRVS